MSSKYDWDVWDKIVTEESTQNNGPNRNNNSNRNTDLVSTPGIDFRLSPMPDSNESTSNSIRNTDLVSTPDIDFGLSPMPDSNDKDKGMLDYLDEILGTRDSEQDYFFRSLGSLGSKQITENNEDGESTSGNSEQVADDLFSSLGLKPITEYSRKSTPGNNEDEKSITGNSEDGELTTNSEQEDDFYSLWEKDDLDGLLEEDESQGMDIMERGPIFTGNEKEILDEQDRQNLTNFDLYLTVRVEDNEKKNIIESYKNNIDKLINAQILNMKNDTLYSGNVTLYKKKIKLEYSIDYDCTFNNLKSEDDTIYSRRMKSFLYNGSYLPITLLMTYLIYFPIYVNYCILCPNTLIINSKGTENENKIQNYNKIRENIKNFKQLDQRFIIQLIKLDNNHTNVLIYDKKYGQLEFFDPSNDFSANENVKLTIAQLFINNDKIILNRRKKNPYNNINLDYYLGNFIVGAKILNNDEQHDQQQDQYEQHVQNLESFEPIPEEIKKSEEVYYSNGFCSIWTIDYTLYRIIHTIEIENTIENNSYIKKFEYNRKLNELYSTYVKNIKEHINPNLFIYIYRKTLIYAHYLDRFIKKNINTKDDHDMQVCNEITKTYYNLYTKKSMDEIKILHSRLNFLDINKLNIIYHTNTDPIFNYRHVPFTPNTYANIKQEVDSRQIILKKRKEQKKLQQVQYTQQNTQHGQNTQQGQNKRSRERGGKNKIDYKKSKKRRIN